MPLHWDGGTAELLIDLGAVTWSKEDSTRHESEHLSENFSDVAQN